MWRWWSSFWASSERKTLQRGGSIFLYLNAVRVSVLVVCLSLIYKLNTFLLTCTGCDNFTTFTTPRSPVSITRRQWYWMWFECRILRCGFLDYDNQTVSLSRCHMNSSCVNTGGDTALVYPATPTPLSFVVFSDLPLAKDRFYKWRWTRAAEKDDFDYMGAFSRRRKPKMVHWQPFIQFTRLAWTTHWCAASMERK